MSETIGAFLRRHLWERIPAGFYRSLGWQYTGTIVGGALTFAYSLSLGVLLGTKDFGRFALAIGFVSVVFQLVELRLHEAVVRYVSEFHEHHDFARMVAVIKMFLLVDIISGLSAFALVVGAAPLANRYLLHDRQGVQVLIMAGVATLLLNVTTATAIGLHRVFGEFRSQAIITMFGGALKLAATLLAIRFFQAGVVGVLFVAIASHLLTNGWLLANGLRILFSRLPAETRGPLALLGDRNAELRRFIGHTYVLSLSMIPTKELDVNLLGYYTSLETVGIYKLAKTFVAAIGTLADPVFFVVYPDIARMWVRKQIDELRIFLRSLTLILGVGGAVACGVSVALVPWIIHRFVGVEYSESASVFRWMIWGLAVWAPLVWVNPLLMAAGRPDLTVKASIAGSAVVLAVYLLAIPVLGARGAALGQALAAPVVMAFAFLFTSRAGVMKMAPA